jgi:ribose transport system ATP-binding protein
MTEPLLAIRDVHKAFGANRALSGVTLDLYAGETHALVGENGAGKSTLMKILSGAHRPDRGSMTLDGAPFVPRNPREARRQGIAMIYQELALAPHLSVEANVMLGQERTASGLILKHEHNKLVRSALRELDHAEIDPQTNVHRLSPGGMQIVEIARALVSNARVVILDEPTSSLSGRDAERLFAVLDRLRGRGLAIVYISHFLEEVERVADRVTVIRDGATVLTGMMESLTTHDIIHSMIGREPEDLFPAIASEPGEVVLETVELAGMILPKRVNLNLRRGEVLGIAGLVGAGRTELLRAIFGLDKVRSGSIKVAGIAASRGRPSDRIAQGIGLLSEDRKNEGLALNLSIEDNLTLAALHRHARRGILNLNDRRSAASRRLIELNVKAAGPKQAINALSGGNQQKIAFARLLHQDADVLLLDEPTRGIDVGAKAEIYRLIRELARRGKAVLMVSSYLPELLGVCDRLAVMRKGVLGETRPIEAWTEHEIMSQATLESK